MKKNVNKKLNISNHTVSAICSDHPQRLNVESIFSSAKCVGSHAKEAKLAQDESLTNAGFFELAQDSCSNFQGIVDGVSQIAFLGYATLSMLEQNGLNRIIVETLAEEVTRKWAELRASDNTTAEYIKELQEKIDVHFRAKQLLLRTSELTLSHGGCCLFIDMGVDDKELEFPLVLSPETVKKGSFRGFRLIEPYLIYPAPYNAYNPLRADYFEPEMYYVQGGIKVHKSRLIRFKNGEITNLLKPAYNFFGIPLTQVMLKYIEGFERTDDATLHIIRNFRITGLKTNLSQLFNGGEDGCTPEDISAIKNRAKMFLEQSSNSSVVLMDKDTEEFFQLNTPLAGLHDLVSLKLELLALISRSPVARLFGTPPKGFNSTGEAEQENWMDHVKNFANKVIYEPYSIMRKVVELSEYGKYSKGVEEFWAPIMEANEQEQATVNHVKAQTAAIYVTNDIITKEEARSSLIADRKGNYNTLEESMPSELKKQIEENQKSKDVRIEEEVKI